MKVPLDLPRGNDCEQCSVLIDVQRRTAYEQCSSFNFNLRFIVFADNKVGNKSLDKFKLRPNVTIVASAILPLSP